MGHVWILLTLSHFLTQSCSTLEWTYILYVRSSNLPWRVACEVYCLLQQHGEGCRLLTLSPLLLLHFLLRSLVNFWMF